MAFVVPTRKGTFEVRESRSTPDGPRSRTLASFKELTDETIEKAQARAAKPPSAGELREAALRAGAPVAGEPVDAAARELLGLLANGKQLDPMLRRLLLDALTREDRSDRPTDPTATVSDAARSASEWIDASPRQRGETLRDLLLLADALPVHLRPTEIRFPRLKSA
ncbi:MAG TPA: hypothetical protein VH275_05540 [Solirubrobacterales bacterium]|jgi:hypothetical protein|nr:hypothetical protein [Solirubrobacterales bacterium]